MKPLFFLTALLNSFALMMASPAQDRDAIKKFLPETTNCQTDIPFKTVDSHSLGLDLYLPDSEGKDFPVLICIHGGAWYAGTKTSELKGIPKLLGKILSRKIAVVSIEYRLSQEATFPAQIQDCNDAIDFIFANASKYRLNNQKIAVMGGSAGGHLASLVGTTQAHTLPEFYSNQQKPSFKITAVVDLFGPSDFIAMRGNSGTVEHDADDSAEAKLIGFPPLKRPDLAKKASPTSYVDTRTPPFLIIHGNKDAVVQFSQSVLLKSYLDLAGVKNELVTVENAGHGGPAFDSDAINAKVLGFLELYLK